MSSDNILHVEIAGGNGVYYKAFIKNIYDDHLGVTLEFNPNEEKLISFSEARLPLSPMTKFELKENEEVEVFTKSSDSDQLGWWPAHIKLMKGEFAVIDFVVNNLTYSDIIPVDRIRAKNNNPPLNQNSFHRLVIDVPDDLIEICQSEQAHADFKKASGVQVVQCCADKKQLVAISTDPSAIKRASLLSDMHLRNLKQKAQLLQKTEEVSKKLETTRMHIRAPYQEEFTVHKELMGLAIGSHGVNIIQARKIDGVISVEIDDNMFRISGETDEAVKSARRILEHVVEKITVPKSLVSKVIGRSGHNIQDIVNRSGVVRVRINDNDGDDDDDGRNNGRGGLNISNTQHATDNNNVVIDDRHDHQDDNNDDYDNQGHSDFIFIGTVESISNAKMLLDYQISHFKEVDRLRLEKQHIDNELKSLAPTQYSSQRMRYDDGPDDRRGGRMRGGPPRGTSGRWSSERQENNQPDNRRSSIDWTDSGTGLANSNHLVPQMGSNRRGRGGGPGKFNGRFRGGRGGVGGRGGGNVMTSSFNGRKRTDDEEATVLDARRRDADDNGADADNSPDRDSVMSSSNEDSSSKKQQQQQAGGTSNQPKKNRNRRMRSRKNKPDEVKSINDSPSTSIDLKQKLEKPNVVNGHKQQNSQQPQQHIVNGVDPKAAITTTTPNLNKTSEVNGISKPSQQQPINAQQQQQPITASQQNKQPINAQQQHKQPSIKQASNNINPPPQQQQPAKQGQQQQQQPQKPHTNTNSSLTTTTTPAINNKQTTNTIHQKP